MTSLSNKKMRWWVPAERLTNHSVVPVCQGFVCQMSRDACPAFERVGGNGERPLVCAPRTYNRSGSLLDGWNGEFCRWEYLRERGELQFLEPPNAPDRDWSQTQWISYLTPVEILKWQFGISIQFLGRRQILLLQSNLCGYHLEFDERREMRRRRFAPPVRDRMGRSYLLADFKNDMHQCMAAMDRGWVAFPCCGISLRLLDLTWHWWPRDTKTTFHALCPGGFWCKLADSDVLARFEIDPSTGFPAEIARVSLESKGIKRYRLHYCRPAGATQDVGFLLVYNPFEAVVLRGSDGKPLDRVTFPVPNPSKPTSWQASVDERGNVFLAGRNRIWRQKNPDSLAESAALAFRGNPHAEETILRRPELAEILRHYPLDGNNVYRILVGRFPRKTPEQHGAKERLLKIFPESQPSTKLVLDSRTWFTVWSRNCTSDVLSLDFKVPGCREGIPYHIRVCFLERDWESGNEHRRFRTDALVSARLDNKPNSKRQKFLVSSVSGNMTTSLRPNSWDSRPNDDLDLEFRVSWVAQRNDDFGVRVWCGTGKSPDPTRLLTNRQSHRKRKS